MATTRLAHTVLCIAVGSLSTGGRVRAQDGAWRVATYLPRPTPAQLNSIAAVPGLTLAVGESGVAIGSSDSGSTWSPVSTGTTRSLRGVAFVDRSTAVAVGLEGTITRTADGGHTWASVSSPVTSALRAVAFLPNGVGVAVGDGGVLLRTENRGLSWVRRDVRRTTALRAVAFASATTVIALGDDGVMLLSRDAGLSWDRRPSGTRAALRGVAFVDWVTGVAVGGDDRRWRAAQVVLRTTDGGATWQSVQSKAAFRMYGVSVIGARSIVAVGEAGAILRSSDAGATWTAHTVGGAWLSAVWRVDSGRAVAVGAYGAVWRSASVDTTWTSVRDGPIDDIRSLASPLPNVIVAAAGSQILRADSGGRFLVAAIAPVPNAPVTHVAFGTSRVGFATTANGWIYRTTDSGASWRSVVGSAPKPMSAVTFVDEKTVVAFGTYHDTTAVFRSADAGITWSKAPSGMMMAFGIASLGPRLTLVVGSGGSVLRGIDDGRAWAYVRHGLTHTMLNGVAIADSTTAIVVGNDGTLLRSVDAGRTWMRMPTLTSMHLTAVAFADAHRGAAVGFGGALLVTDDAGLTWRVVPTSARNTLFAVLWRGPNELLAAGEGGIVLRVTRSAAIADAPAHGPNAVTNLTTDGVRHD
jgi:photosystem II stability/assembly factor-like uncharacterized protein